MPYGASHEVEIKLRVADAAAIRRRLRSLGARPGPRLHEANVLFDTAGQSLRGRGVLLRIRVERPARRLVKSNSRDKRIAELDSWMFPTRAAQPGIVTFKGPPSAQALADAAAQSTAGGQQGAYKIRREIEFGVSDACRFRETLEALGLRPAFYYEKFRTTYRARRFRNLVISLDESPAGIFLELEGPPAVIDRARHSLGYQPEDAILLSYGELYAAYREASGRPMTDMLFVCGPALSS